MQIRILNRTCLYGLDGVFEAIGVHKDAFSIMAGKSYCYLIYLDSLPSLYANILKQEFLSAGGDVALPQDALTARRNLPAVIIATLSQIKRVLAKLNRQPYFLQQLAGALQEKVHAYSRTQYAWEVKRGVININTKRPLLMGVINVTPDSFSGDGFWKEGVNLEREIKQKVSAFIRAGVKIVDIGGESSRPGAVPVSAREEMRRVIPVIRIVKRHFPRLIVSLDTCKADVAEAGIKAGADIINDIKGMRSRKMRKVVSRYKAGAVIMHMKGTPVSMQKGPFYKDVVEEIYNFFSQAVEKCAAEGISRRQLVLDPGIGFGKRLCDNTEIIRRLGEFKTLGLPLMLGLSRKSFIGSITRRPVAERLAGTIAACVMGIQKGAGILRVHDAAEVRDAVLVAENIIGN